MSAETTQPQGPDLAQGVPVSTLAEGAMLPGHVKGEPAIAESPPSPAMANSDTELPW